MMCDIRAILQTHTHTQPMQNMKVIHFILCFDRIYLKLCPPTNNSATASGSKDQIFFKYKVALQLSSCSVQVCLSMGYLVRSMLQATVVVILDNRNVI